MRKIIASVSPCCIWSSSLTDALIGNKYDHDVLSGKMLVFHFIYAICTSTRTAHHPLLGRSRMSSRICVDISTGTVTKCHDHGCVVDDRIHNDAENVYIRTNKQNALPTHKIALPIVHRQAPSLLFFNHVLHTTLYNVLLVVHYPVACRYLEYPSQQRWHDHRWRS